MKTPPAAPIAILRFSSRKSAANIWSRFRGWQAQFRLNRIRLFEPCAILAMVCLVQCHVAAQAQDATAVSAGDGSTPSSGAGTVLNVSRGNSLEGLFTPQPLFPSAQTLMYPEATPPPAGELNPLKGLFTPPNQWSTPQTVLNPESQPPDGEVNHLKGVFTPENTFATPQTVLNPQPTPRYFVPEREVLWGTDEVRIPLLLEHMSNTQANATPSQAMPAGGSPQQAAKPQPGKTQQKNDKTSTSQKTPASKKNDKTPASQKTPGTAEAQKSAPAMTPPATPGETSPLKMSLSLMRAGDNEKSLQLLEQILQAHPDDASAHYLKAVVLVRMKQYKDAAEQYNDVMRLNPGTQLSTYARAGLTKIGF